MESPTSDSRHDRMAVRLSVIISRLLSGETLVLKSLSEEFGVSERTLRRDLHQRLIHLDIRNDDGVYRLSESSCAIVLPVRFHLSGHPASPGYSPSRISS